MESSPLVGLALNTLESFDNILKFCNAQEYLKLGQTCRDLHSVFVKDNTWNILVHGSRSPIDDGTDSDNKKPIENKAVVKFVPTRGINKDPFQFVGDPNIPTAFDQIMIGHNLIRVKQERSCSDTIIWGESSNDFVCMWLVYAMNNDDHMYKEVPFLGKLEQMVHGQDVSWSRNETTFLKAFAALVEANILHILQGALQATIDNHILQGALQATIDNSSDEYPMLTTSGVHAFVLSMHMSLEWPLWRQDHLEEFHEVFPENGGRRGARRGQFAPVYHYGADSFLQASTYRMIQRLIFRAGVVKFEHAVFNYLVYLVSELTREILSGMSWNWREEVFQTSEEEDASKFVVRTRHLEFAAKSYWLPITKVLRDDNDDTFYDTIAESVGAAQWSSWSAEEKAKYCESLERHEDMDLDMADYVAEKYGGKLSPGTMQDDDSNYEDVVMRYGDSDDYSDDGEDYDSDDEEME